MSEEKNNKPVGVGYSLISSAGIGALLTFLLNLFSSGLCEKFGPDIVEKLVSGVPIVSPLLAFLMTVAWNKWGCESAEVAALRSALKRDVKEFKEILKDSLASPEAKARAQKGYDETRLQIAGLGRSGLNVSLDVEQAADPDPS
jgi:hypothetical protein